MATNGCVYCNNCGYSHRISHAEVECGDYEEGRACPHCRVGRTLFTWDDGWILTSTKHPKPGQKLEWLCPTTGDVVQGSMVGKLWMLPEGTYVYYLPTFWRPRAE